MNIVSIIGRLTADPKITHTQSDKPLEIAHYNVAVTRKFKDSSGEYLSDFIPCLAFGRNAEFLEKYFHKGMKVAVTGHIQTGSYEKDGHRIYTFEVVADSNEFVENKAANQEAAQSVKSDDAQAPVATGNDDFMKIADEMGDLPSEIPFA